MYKQNVLQWGMLSGASRQMSVNIGSGGNNSLQGAVTSSLQLNSNTWTHVAVTYTNSTVRFYVNGLLTDTRTKTYTMGSNNKAFSISTGSQSFDGRLDDLRYYNRALSDTEIADVYGLRVTNPGFHLADALGSIVALTDTGKVIRTEYDYEPFGATTVTGAGNKNSYKFTAREDDGTGLYYYRARYYHPALGRFASEDPIEYAGEDINLYAYVKNDPMMFLDPLGLSFMLCQRNADVPGFWAWVINTYYGGAHSYVVYYPMGGHEGRIGWGVSGGKKGDLPGTETKFGEKSCRGCKRTKSPLKYGVGAGKPGTLASDAEIIDCIKNRPLSHDYDPEKYNCRDWAKGATKDCGLDCN